MDIIMSTQHTMILIGESITENSSKCSKKNSFVRKAGRKPDTTGRSGSQQVEG